MSELKLQPSVVNITVVKKTDQVIEFGLTDAVGVAVDLSADTVKFTAKSAFGGTAKINTKTNTSGMHSDAVNGKTRFTLTKTDLAGSSDSTEETWVYEVRRVIGGTGQELVYLQGNLKLTPVIGVAP